MTFIFRNRTIFWDISKWNRGQKKWDGGSIIFFSLLLFRLLNVVDFSLLKMNNMLTLLLNLRSGMHESILSLTFCSIHIVLWFTIHIILSSFFFFFFFWPFSFTLISSISVLIRKLKLFISQNNTIQLYNKVSKLEFIVTV